MKVTQGQFSFLPDLTDAEISAQVQYALGQGWSLAVEHTDDPHPRNTYWSMWGTPMFDLHDAAGVMLEVNACRKERPEEYVKVLAFDSNKGFEFGPHVVHGAAAVARAGVRAGAAGGAGRNVRYTLRSYATGKPSGERYAP